jgi:hypothetical protein
MFWLREHGYTGPIDQDGYPARVVGHGDATRIERLDA